MPGSLGYPNWSHDGKYIYYLANTSPGGADQGFFRVNLATRQQGKVMDTRDLRSAGGSFGTWSGLAPDDSPLVLRDVGVQEIYALDWEAP